MIKKIFIDYSCKIFSSCKRLLSGISLRYKLFLINLLGLSFFLICSLYLDNFRDRLIEASRETLLIKAKIISNILATAASKDENIFAEGIDMRKNRHSYLRIYKILARSVTNQLLDLEENRAIIYDRFGSVVHDTNDSFRDDFVSIKKVISAEESPGLIEQFILLGRNILTSCYHFIFSGDLTNKKYNTDVLRKKSVEKALTGRSVNFTSWNADKRLVITVTIPVQRFHAVLGAFSLTSNGNNIDKAVAEEQERIVTIFLVAFLVVAFLSFSLAYTIVNPIMRLSRTAKDITSRTFLNTHTPIPVLSKRDDEIGYLSQAIGNMTKNLIGRITAIENFAADVTHELKNPLTSLRSAIEILPQIQKKSDIDKLLAIMKDDTMRMDRLISDISEASKLDAELGREKPEMINIAKILRNHVIYFNDMKASEKYVVLHIDDTIDEEKFIIKGYALRLEQVFRNVIDNAHSFNHKKLPIDIYLKHNKKENVMEIMIADQAIGIIPENLENIFERFYSDRQEDQKQHSGLGLSICRQIVHAHGGRIWAENRPHTILNDDNTIESGTIIFIHIPTNV